MELPPYRVPTAKSVFRHTWEKGKQYLHKMGGIILVCSVIIWFLGYFPNHDSYSTATEQQENSYIGHIGKAIEPVFAPLGFDWKATVSLIAGLPAKEIVVSTLGVLYTGEGDDSTLLQKRLETPSPISNKAPFNKASALAFMVFVLIYFPCIATMIAIVKESGSWLYGLFSLCYNTLLAWGLAWITYRITLWFI